jgi:hypothetical protein
MRNPGISILITFLASISVFAQTQTPKLQLPELHTIQSVTLGPSFSCRPTDEFKRGYQKTALFLSAYSRERNSPDLLFNGACQSKDYFEASTAGDGMSLIADLGTDVSLDNVSALRAFNLNRVNSPNAYSKFVRAVNVELNHTYAVLLNESDKRGLFLFTVVDYVPNQKVGLRYAVKSYQVALGGRVESSGFDWNRVSAIRTRR